MSDISFDCLRISTKSTTLKRSPLSPPSQASAVPVRNTEAVGVSHSVPALPEIPSPSGLEKHSKLGLILPVATSMKLPSVSVEILKQHSFPLTFHIAKSPPMTMLFHPICIGMPHWRMNKSCLDRLANLQSPQAGFCRIRCWFRWSGQRSQMRCC